MSDRVEIEGLKRRNKLQRDPHFGQGYDLECPHCGRLFATDDEPKLKAGDPCPDGDCPTYWELVGKNWSKA
jgi:hypothetical protein